MHSVQTVHTAIVKVVISDRLAKPHRVDDTNVKNLEGFLIEFDSHHWAAFLSSYEEQPAVRNFATAKVNGNKPLVYCACSFGHLDACPFSANAPTATPAASREVGLPVMRTANPATLHVVRNVSGHDNLVGKLLTDETCPPGALKAARMTTDGAIEAYLARHAARYVGTKKEKGSLCDEVGSSVGSAVLQVLHDNLSLGWLARFIGTGDMPRIH